MPAIHISNRTVVKRFNNVYTRENFMYLNRNDEEVQEFVSTLCKFANTELLPGDECVFAIYYPHTIGKDDFGMYFWVTRKVVYVGFIMTNERQKYIRMPEDTVIMLNKYLKSDSVKLVDTTPMRHMFSVIQISYASNLGGDLTNILSNIDEEFGPKSVVKFTSKENVLSIARAKYSFVIGHYNMKRNQLNKKYIKPKYEDKGVTEDTDEDSDDAVNEKE